jgi:hypothetical protein
MDAIFNSPKNRSFWAGKTIAQMAADRQARLEEKKRKEDAKRRRS